MLFTPSLKAFKLAAIQSELAGLRRMEGGDPILTLQRLEFGAKAPEAPLNIHQAGVGGTLAKRGEQTLSVARSGSHIPRPLETDL